MHPKPASYFRDRLIQQFASSKTILCCPRGADFIAVVSNSEASQILHTEFIQKLRKEVACADKNLIRLIVGNTSAINKTQLAGLLSDYGCLKSLEMTNSLNTSTEYGEGASATLRRNDKSKAIPRQIEITALGCKWDVAVSVVRSSNPAERPPADRKARPTRDFGQAGPSASGVTERCYDFSRGRCSRGTTCKFLHVAASNEAKQIACRDFNQGSCSRSPCRFAHVAPETRPARLPEICRLFQQGSCRRQTCRFRHSLLPPGEEEDRSVPVTLIESERLASVNKAPVLAGAEDAAATREMEDIPEGKEEGELEMNAEEEEEWLLCPALESLTLTVPVTHVGDVPTSAAFDEDAVTWQCDCCDCEVPSDASCYTNEDFYCLCIPCYQAKQIETPQAPSDSSANAAAPDLPQTQLPSPAQPSADTPTLQPETPSSGAGAASSVASCSPGSDTLCPVAKLLCSSCPWTPAEGNTASHLNCHLFSLDSGIDLAWLVSNTLHEVAPAVSLCACGSFFDSHAAQAHNNDCEKSRATASMIAMAIHGSNACPEQGLDVKVEPLPFSLCEIGTITVEGTIYVCRDYGQYTAADYSMCFYLSSTADPLEPFTHHTPSREHQERADALKLDLADSADHVTLMQGAVGKTFGGKGKCAEREVFIAHAMRRGPSLVVDLDTNRAELFTGTASGPLTLVTHKASHFCALFPADAISQQ